MKPTAAGALQPQGTAAAGMGRGGCGGSEGADFGPCQVRRGKKGPIPAGFGSPQAGPGNQDSPKGLQGEETNWYISPG